MSWGYWAMNGAESTGGTRVYGTLDWYGFLDHTQTQSYSWLATGLQLVLSPQSAQSAPTL